MGEFNRARSAELYPSDMAGMYLTTNDEFAFKAHGKTVYMMPYRVANALIELVEPDSIAKAVITLRAFVPNLDLNTAANIVRYLRTNFRRL